MSSILNRLKENQPKPKKLFGIIAAPRLGGKTTTIGTLPGRTLLMQSEVRESGSESAKALAAQLGHKLDVLNFSSLGELFEILTELKDDTEFDNVAVDGLSAITEMKYEDPKMRELIKRDNWAAFREIGDTATSVIMALKALTYSESAAKPKNTFLTVALSLKQDKNGEVVDVSLDVKGNVATSAVTKFGEAVLTILPPSGPRGEGDYKLLTRTMDVWPARVDGVLRENNPGVIEPADLRKVLELRGVV
jgi:hypothetical protein